MASVAPPPSPGLAPRERRFASANGAALIGAADEHGRVTVHFPWDRDGARDARDVGAQTPWFPRNRTG